MKKLNIKDIIGETTYYDKKGQVEIKKPKSWCKSVSAFANTLGGFLIFGINDNDEIIGIEDYKEVSEEISLLIKTHLDPVPLFKLDFYKHEDEKVLIVLQIFKGDDTPYFYKDSGVLEAYTRIGNESVKASSIELKRLVLKGMNQTYDTRPSSYKFNDYSFSKLRERFKRVTGRSFDDRNYLSFGIYNEDGLLTNAGALIADDSPIYCSRVFCTRWNGLDKAGGLIDALDDAEYRDSVLTLIENAANFIKRNNRKMWRKTADSRINYYDYPERSYYEALVNAFAHRDYLILGSEVHVDIYDDRLEITSPGGMMNGLLIQDLNVLDVASHRRNPLLTDILQRLDYMERRGSGFKKIIDGYKTQANFNKKKIPTFDSSNSFFRVTLPNLNYGIELNDFNAPIESELNDEELRKDLIRCVNENRRISVKDLSLRYDIPLRTLRKKIKELDCIEFVGRGSSGHWRVK